MECQYCDRDGIKRNYTPEEFLILCDHHAKEKGFCIGCNAFLGGTELLDFSEGFKSGYCQECWDELRRELADIEYYEDY